MKHTVFLKNISFFIGCFFYAFSLLCTLRKKYEVIHLHDNLLYFLAPVLSTRYRIVITVHGIRGFAFYDNRFLWFFFKKGLSAADTLIAVNKEDKKILEKQFHHVVYVPNGVDLSLYEKIRPSIEKKIVFIGRLHEQKGLIYLLQAFDEVAPIFPDFKLEIIGELNAYGKELRNEFHNGKIIWRGYLADRKEIVHTLKSAYCIALPSLWEGLPLTLFEALASGRPVIVSDIPAFKSVISSEAVFCATADKKDLAHQIIALIKNKSLADRYGLKGKKLSQIYDWNSIARKMEEVYE